ncbi:DUF4476 domain-containing protein [Bacteroides helcogenes]|uniref:DUF4476 domain-containing protein n=1 Tax=Bacteroides helcogenes (strain ATCC 35417 / DSM 20613 / JCM 6297 / CCUG 15421 / P 36-108) TaxID=693979 RepID=E6STT9_BACT6|nr:DUF4476 domain-containing protein [Bacteroides helcogenes]ADV42292.1 hypothetical protein Bache_0262 [Bacteroides helcogenes P 36-108]MDY5237254.1 DUF4476 domain-containing protein [Bacteroides helcogenes]
MIRHLMLSICLALFAFSDAKAESVDGIRIESPYRKIVVVVDGQPVCLPTFSCFVANLRGSYRVEIYAATSRGENLRRENLLYDECVSCFIGEVTEIFIPGGRPMGGKWHDQLVMSSSAFEQFIELMKKQVFDSDRKTVLDHALQTSCFTTDQCIRLMEFYSFSSEKKELMKRMYPKIVDKPNFYYAIDKLDFSTDKNEISAFIRQYHATNN